MSLLFTPIMVKVVFRIWNQGSQTLMTWSVSKIWLSVIHTVLGSKSKLFLSLPISSFSILLDNLIIAMNIQFVILVVRVSIYNSRIFLCWYIRIMIIVVVVWPCCSSLFWAMGQRYSSCETISSVRIFKTYSLCSVFKTLKLDFKVIYGCYYFCNVKAHRSFLTSLTFFSL